MTPDIEKILDIDYLVFSSHKTATQTLRRTLNYTGLECINIHHLPDIGLRGGDFQGYLDEYLAHNRKKLNVCSVFREPMERHISSFFQGYGTRPIRLKEVSNEFETIIYKYTIKQLQDKFIQELDDKSLIGIRESLHEICNELHISVEKLNYNSKIGYGFHETENIRLYIFRFDFLINNIENLLSDITGKKIIKQNANMGSSKWYKDIYSEFKASLVVPHHTIMDIYESKRDLINLFYLNNYDSILKQAFIKFGNKSVLG